MSTIQKWGNSLAVRIPSAVARRAELRAGTEVEVVARKDAIIVKPASRRQYKLRDLLKAMKPGRLHGETDFGPDVGREITD
ncbi:MAG: AbrB/MazE/SpoVT family DNA-binding domain-containing protein [Planctomycetes bacterium]|nr:AbrB/MazE/SpoVT family DNA-binding domain-containing protein [Planctomycetota bacterium]